MTTIFIAAPAFCGRTTQLSGVGGGRAVEPGEPQCPQRPLLRLVRPATLYGSSSIPRPGSGLVGRRLPVRPHSGVPFLQVRDAPLLLVAQPHHVELPDAV